MADESRKSPFHDYDFVICLNFKLVIGLHLQDIETRIQTNPWDVKLGGESNNLHNNVGKCR